MGHSRASTPSHITIHHTPFFPLTLTKCGTYSGGAGGAWGRPSGPRGGAGGGSVKKASMRWWNQISRSLASMKLG